MKIPFGKTFSVTPAQLRDGVAQGLIDGYMDHDDSKKSRLGLVEAYNLGSSAIDGLYVDNNSNNIIVTEGLVYVNGSACTGGPLNVGTLCTFAEDGNYVFVGHGGRIARIDVITSTVDFIDTVTAPDNVTHVAYIQGYLISNGTGGVNGDTFYTGPYTSADYLTVFEVYNNESLPDGCSAVVEDGQFAYNFGTRSVEISVNDGVTPWAKYSAAYIPYGIHAPYSVAKIDNTFFWLGQADGALRVLTMTGNSAKTISTPYDVVINNMAITTDAYGYPMGIDGHTFYVLQFPSESITLVYHVQKDAWYRWAYYNRMTGEYGCYIGRCHCYNPHSNQNLIGSRIDGRVGIVSNFSDFGNTIRFELTSGNISGETYRLKRSGRMRFQLQRGMTTSATAEPIIRWQHRDDGGNWKPERTVSLGYRGHYDYLGQLDRCGTYRQRQHRIIFTEDTCQLVLVEVEEQSELVER